MHDPPTLINLHPSEYMGALRYYPFAVNLDKCMVGCNTLNDVYMKYVFQTKQKIQIWAFLI